jgi:hypothetical protein
MTCELWPGAIYVHRRDAQNYSRKLASSTMVELFFPKIAISSAISLSKTNH